MMLVQANLHSKPIKETDLDIMKVVVDGSGYWGKNLVRNFHALGALAGICDKDPRVLQSLREKTVKFELTSFKFSSDVILYRK
jgi:hypothetical protein